MRLANFPFLLLLISAMTACDRSEQVPEQFPSGIVTVIVPYVPGGASDTIARLLAEEMNEILGQPFVVENRSGGFGILAIERMARSDPDGHTVLLGNLTTSTLTPILYPDRISVDFRSDVAAIARVASVPNLLVATARNFEPNTLHEVINYAKEHPGEVRYGSAGVGSFSHLDMLMLARAADIDMIHVPTSGGAGQALNDLGNGDIQFALMNAATGAGMVESGTVKPLAIVADQRLPRYPDVPTMAELGFVDIGTEQWFGLFAPAATPSDIVTLLHSAVGEALGKDRLTQAFDRSMIKADPTSSPEEAGRWLDAEFVKWARIISEADLDLQR